MNGSRGLFEYRRRRDKIPNTNFVYRSNKSLHRGISFGGCEKIVERRGRDNPRHDALIITKEYES